MLNLVFFRAFNAVFSKVGRAASEEVVLALLRTKNACQFFYMPPRRARLLFMKIFRTGSSAVINECQRNFQFLSIELQLTIRTAIFCNVLRHV